ncbi:MAG: insulinase family protein [Planctomycetota bacterium]
MTLPDVEELRLDNGFRALLAPRRSLPVVASVLWYEVGSRDERTGESGVSHFLEHMMFKGTDRYGKGQIDLLTSKMGGSNNAFTDNDGTAYYFALAADRWETALEIERSRMRGCLLDPQEFASEKNVVLEELAMGEDDPWRPVYQAAEALLYQVHPYHNPVIGYREDLERLPVDGMRAYYDRNYGPNRAFLVVAGDIDTARTAARIQELFGDLPASAAPRAGVLAEPAPVGERRAVLRTPHAVARLCMAWPTARAGERSDYALDVLAHDLGVGKNSRLYRRLVLEEELVTDVSAINETRLDPGALFVLCELRDGADIDEVERIVREEVEGLIRTGVGKKDLARIRAQIRASFLFQDETALDHALKLARFEALTPDGWRTLANVLPTYDSLTTGELREVATRFLLPARLVTVQAVPAPEAPAGRKVRTKQGAAKRGSAKKSAAKAPRRAASTVPAPGRKARRSAASGRSAPPRKAGRAAARGGSDKRAKGRKGKKR